MNIYPAVSNIKRWQAPFLSGMLMVLVVIMYWPILDCYFVSDDWSILNTCEYQIPNNGLKFFLTSLAHPPTFRPLVYLYAFLLYNLFGLKHVVFNVSILLIHFANSLLLVYIVRKIINHDIIAWATGYLYALASFFHITTFAWSVAGHFETLSAFFLYLSIIFLLNKYFKVSAGAYLLAVLSKPSTIFLPPVLFVLLILINKDKKEAWMEQFRKLRGHLFIFTAFFIYYLIFKIMFRQEYDCLRLSLWGGHIIKKVVYYLGLIPLVISPLLYHKHFIVAAYIVLCVIFFAKKRMLADKTFLDKYYIGFWVSWLVIGMIPPCALLTNVIAEYYFTYSLCPLIVLLLIFIKLFFTQLSAKEAVFKIIVFLLISTSFISGTLSLRKGNEKGIFSTVETRGAYLAKIIHENMLKIYPVLPKDVFIVLPKEIYRCLGAEDNALRLWYNNPHLDTGILRVEDYNVCSQHDKIPIVVTNLNTYASRHNLPQRKKYLLNYNKGIIALARIDIDPNDVVLDAHYDDIF